MLKPRLFITRPLAPSCVERLLDETQVEFWRVDSPVPRSELLSQLREVDGLLCAITERIDAELLDSAPNLRVVSNVAVGVDNIDLTECRRRGIRVGNTPSVLSGATADLAFGLLLAAARNVASGREYVRSGEWRTWELHGLLGQEVHGQTLGIIGLGRIGGEMAQRARGFGMRVLYTNRSPADETQAEFVHLETLLRTSDFISIHCPLTDETHGLIGAKEIAMMKPTAILVNTARGPIVDQSALYEALKARQIWAAGLDVFETEPLTKDDPLLELDNVVVTPHVGSATVATRLKMMEIAVDNVLAGVRGEPLPHEVTT